MNLMKLFIVVYFITSINYLTITHIKRTMPSEWFSLENDIIYCSILLLLLNMSFKVTIEQLSVLFNPDGIHRGISLERLKHLGKIPALQSLLKTNFRKGLLNDHNEHEQRRAYFGNNQPYIKKQCTIWQLINKNFEDELIRLMVVASIVSLILGVLTEGLRWGWIEGFSIFFAVALVVCVSSINDYANQKSFQLIKGGEQKKLVRVYRGGKLYHLNSTELMVGDVLQIMGGDRTDVDGILISGDDITVDESQITGEAIQVKKQVPFSYDRQQADDPFIISGSRIMSGIGIMLVVAVGKHSYYGSLAAKMDEEHVDSPLKCKINDLSNQMNDGGQFIGLITFSSIVLHYLYWCFQDDNPWSSLFSSQSLHKLVQAILITFTIDVALPQSLPLLVTIAMSVAAKNLQKQNIFVKHLNQCETMGSINNLCLSKTGFISKNLLTVSQIFVQERITNIISRQIMSENTCHLLSLAIIMDTDANPIFIEENGATFKMQHIGNKTESALLELAYRMGFNYERFRINAKVKRIYSPIHHKKKMATIYKDQGDKLFLFVKGSPKFLLPYCSHYINRYEQIERIDSETKSKIQNAKSHFENTNQKIVIVAFKQINNVITKWSQVKKDLVLVAMIGIKDALRVGVRETIQQCQQLGINVRMLSNQNRPNAIGAAKQSGILPQDWVQSFNDYTAIEGSDFRQLVSGLAKEDKECRERRTALQNFKLIQQTLKIIYRASAEDKLLLAIGLKECGNVVAVAGNGTNDTQALRKADVSIAMGLTCNYSAKEASDIVILDDNFSSILKTIRWGRHTLNTIRKFLALQLTINLVAAIMALLGAVFVGESPLNPMQMLWINLVIDLLGSISLIMEAPLPTQFTHNPQSRKDKILTANMIKFILVQTFIQVVILSWILFKGPQAFGIVSSVGVQRWNNDTGKHYSLFFDIFILLQIFNEFNVRDHTFQNINIFEGLSENPLFLCFFMVSLILQFFIIKYGGVIMHLTELSFKENIFCLILASISVSGNLLFKAFVPKHITISKNGLQIGSFRFYWREDKRNDSVPQILKNNKPLAQSQLQVLSPEFSLFLVKRRTMNLFSYIEQKDTIRQWFNSQYSNSDAEDHHFM